MRRRGAEPGARAAAAARAHDSGPLGSIRGLLVAISGGDAEQTAMAVRRELTASAGMIVDELTASDDFAKPTG